MMKSLITAAFAIVFAFNMSGQSAKSWDVDKSHASVNFSIDHFFTAVTGKFREFDGAINFDPNDLKGSKAIFKIEVPSIDTDDSERDAHLQTADFFDAARYSSIKFESTKFESLGDNEYKVSGDLSMRGETKPVDFTMTIKGVMDNPWKDGYQIMGVEIESTLDRTNWGVGTGSWAATTIVGDEVEFSITMELDGKK